MTAHYLVADHVFSIEAPQAYFDLLPNYAPFRCASPAPSAPVFTIRVEDEPLQSAKGWESVYTDRSDDDMPRIEMYRAEGRWLFRISASRDGEIVSTMCCTEDWSEVRLRLQPAYIRFAIDNAAMLIYAFSTVNRQTLVFHSSVTVRSGKAFMFLGHSGTGKSTHSRQWLEAFEDAKLLNDDNPIVRLWENEVRVYGTPWSGKTPCYINDSAPVAALVQLAQAPENKIQRLRMTQAYPYILGSVSGLKIQPQMMDAIYNSIAQLLERCPVYKLECLPNTDAAQLCAQTCLS